MIKKYRIIPFFLVFLIFLFTGCGSKEVESLAVVTLVGVDYTNENGKDLYTVSSTILNPLNQKKEGEQSTDKNGQEKVLIGKGRTMEEAVINFTANSSRVPFYGQTSAFILGERMAEEKASEGAEAGIRYGENRPKIFMMVTKGKAVDILQSEPTTDKLLSKELKDLAMNKALTNGFSCGIFLCDFTAWLESPDRDAVATLVNMVPSEEPDSSQQNLVQGLAIFRNDKLVGWLNKEETMGYLLLTQKINRGQIPITVIKDHKEFSYYLGTSKSKIQPVVNGNKISYRIDIKTMGAITESAVLDLNAENIKELESLIEDTLQNLTMRTVNKAKEFNSDFLGLTEKLHRTNLSAWQTLGPEWRKAFCQAEVEVVVDAKIVQTGNIAGKLNIRTK